MYISGKFVLGLWHTNEQTRILDCYFETTWDYLQKQTHVKHTIYRSLKTVRIKQHTATRRKHDRKRTECCRGVLCGSKAMLQVQVSNLVWSTLHPDWRYYWNKASIRLRQLASLPFPIHHSSALLPLTLCSMNYWKRRKLSHKDRNRRELLENTKYAKPKYNVDSTRRKLQKTYPLYGRLISFPLLVCL